jgi:hypothetical protein
MVVAGVVAEAVVKEQQASVESQRAFLLDLLARPDLLRILTMLEMTEMVYKELVRAVKAAQEAMENTVPTL